MFSYLISDSALFLEEGFGEDLRLWTLESNRRLDDYYQQVLVLVVKDGVESNCG